MAGNDSRLLAVLALFLALLSSGAQAPGAGSAPDDDLYLVPRDIAPELTFEALPIHEYPDFVLASIRGAGALSPPIRSRLTPIRSTRVISYRAWAGPLEPSPESEVEAFPEGYYLVAFSGPIDAGWKSAVEALGLAAVDSASPYGLVVRGRGPALVSLLRLRTSLGYEAVRGIMPIPIETRADEVLLRIARGEIPAASVAGLKRTQDGLFGVRLEAFAGESVSEIAGRIQSIAGRASPSVAQGDPDVFLVRGPEILSILRNFPEVSYIEAARERELHDNLAAKDYILNVEPVWSEPSLTYNGTGVIVGHNDTGVDLSHADLPPGAIVATMGAMSSTDNGHGTHTAGSVLGRGVAAASPTNTFGCGDGTTPLPTVRGMAWGARLATNNLFDSGLTTETTMMRWSYQQGARISTNSWGYVSLFTYSSHASAVDGLVRDADVTAPGNQDFLIFFSAGNSGPGSGTIGSPGTAKNAVTVGASQNDRCGAYVGASPDIDSIANFSGRGPAQGRIKPDLVAAGTDILSVQSSDPASTHPWDQSWTGSSYATNTGTSMSTPLAAGAGAVFFEAYQDRFGRLPSPALAKAALVNGAVDLGFGYPSFQQGWGRLNLRNAIEGPPGGAIRYFDQTEVVPLTTGASWSREFEVLSSVVPLKISLVWTDPPAPGGSTSPLVNDLDLEVVDPSGTVFRGNVFTGSFSTPDPSPVTDTANNVENVFVRTPAVGRWTVRVSSALTTVDPPGLSGQDFALVYSADAIDCIAPPPPDGLTSVVPGSNRVDLSWNSAPGATTYNVYRALASGGPFVPLANVSTTSYVDFSVSAGTAYFYRVSSVNAEGCESGPSGVVSATAVGDCTIPPEFAGLESVSSSGGACSVDLSWSPASSNCGNASVSYNIYRATIPGFTPGPATLVDSCVSGTSYQDANVASSTTYYYVVQAEDGTSSGGGPCNGGNVDGNLVERSGGAAQTPLLLYSNDFEGPDDFAHAPVVALKGDSWQGIQTACPAAGGTGTYRFGGASCSANYTDDNFASAGPSLPISVPAGAFNMSLTFRHRFELEQDAGGVYDGGYVAASVDGSPFQPVESSRLSGSGYNAVIDGPCSNGVGTAVFSGTSAGYASGSYLTTEVDLDSVCDDITGGTGGCQGRSVQFRFVGATDCFMQQDGWFLDNVSVDADLAGSCTVVPDPALFFTVSSKSGENVLEWVNPASGGTVIVRYRTDVFPNGPSDGALLLPPAGTPGAHQSFVHGSLANGTTVYYALFVENGGNFSSPRFASGRPQALTGKTRWIYNTGAASVAPPGIGSVYAVSNDSILHSMVGGASGGTWPSGWRPLPLDAPAQSRPPVASVPLGGATKVVLVGTQAGVVHAVDATTGGLLWTSPILGERVQAAPAAMFTAFGGAYDLVFAATRNSSADNRIVALRLADGLEAWSFTNGGGADAIGIVSGSAALDYPNKRLYFASRSPVGGSPNTLWCIEFTDVGATLLWARAIGDIDGSPVLFGGKLFVGTNASKVYAVNPATGANLWSAPFDAANGPVKGFIWPGFGTPTVYFSTTSTVWAVNDLGTSATEKWRVTSIPSPSTPLLVPATKYLYVGGSDGKLHQLDVSATPPTLAFEVLGAGTAAVGAPSFDRANSILYVGTTLGAIYAIAFPLQ